MKYTGLLIVNIGCWIVMVLIGSSASAADLPQRMMAPIPLPSIESWTGFYVGAGGGGSFLNNKISATPGSDPGSPGISGVLNGLGAQGGMFTLNAGYDYQMTPSFVVGVFGDYDFQNLKTSVDVNIAAIPLSVHGEIGVNRQWSIGGRIGYLASPRTLVFVSGGYTQLGLSDFTATASGAFPTLNLVAAVPTISGGFIGAGMETKLTSNISLRGEYRYTQFGSGQVTLPTIDGTDINSFELVRVSPTLQTIKASVNYRF
jgi:outer membrane immunogenic protein